ncbi:HEXXH motif-containing putative peptide modification protein [Vibrio profundum]|uniref:aKG-HExxH-type peptide beta-hydroxylase n=1 Tax=Vibrio profundum TaxID=2910247 RepID=UPI003D11F907
MNKKYSLDFDVIDWSKPNPQEVKALVNINSDEVLDSLCYMADYLDVPNGLLDFLVQDNVRESISYCRPQLYSVHEKIKLDIEHLDKRKAENILESFVIEVIEKSKSKNQCRINPYGSGYHKDIHDMMFSIREKDNFESYNGIYQGVKSKIFAPNVSDVMQTFNCINKIFSIMEELNNAHKKEIDTLISDIILIDSNGINAGTSFNLSGAMYLRVLASDTEHYSRMIEHISHEAAHSLLYQLWIQKKIISDDDGTYYTPFRLDHRPLSGVYHAMFVLARTIYTFNYFFDSDSLDFSINDISSHYNEANNHLSFNDKFFKTVKVLNESQKLTDFGRKIMDDCINLVFSCQHKI